ncbi:ABC transporter permease [Hoyosella sp. YIM 151337]|uniref:ABC transporter permease n=1 Tax=Hoyosella sp. YIM 151337 TaxID=2992742 RepID=UPI002235687E|nr:ABC transporter permease [Hoyosella sp. YIM 151337]MCW4352053.1 ABC transporter permease [Hoyosella sp. YIM 151337]
MTTATARRRGPEVMGSGGARHPFAGTATMTRLALRRDRIRVPVWVGALTLLTVGSLQSFRDTYPTLEDRQTVAQLADLPAMIGMVGRSYQPQDYNFGVMLGHQMTVMTALVFGLMSILLMVRHTRAEEEAGRAELLRSSVVGRHATLASALILVVSANLLAGLLTALGVASSGLEGITTSGSFLYGASLAAAGIVFAGVTAITVQITEYGRGAMGMALGVLGGAYALRAAGDIGENFLRWLSPLFWGQASRPFAVDERWWPLALTLATAGILILVGFRMSIMRDVGAGLRPPKLGAPEGSAALTNPLGFAVRLQRAAAIAWIAGLAVFGLTYGMLVNGVEDMLEQLTALGDVLPDIPGASLVDSWVAMLITFLSIIASIQAVLAVNRLRSEENAGRAEPILATGVSRSRWMGSHLTVAFVSSALVVMAAGLGLGGAGAIALGDPEFLVRMLGAAAAHIPAVWFAVGVAAALFGVAPRLQGLAWVIPVYGVLVVYMGAIFGFPEWMYNYSPFGHISEVPAAPLEWTPLIVLIALTAALTTAGLAGFRRRDLESK